MARPFNLQEVTTLYGLGKLVRASGDLEATLAAIANAACELTNAEESFILLLDGDGHLVVRAGGARGEALPVPAWAGIAERALSERTTLIIPDIHGESPHAGSDTDVGSGDRAYLAVPLVWNGLSIGVVDGSRNCAKCIRTRRCGTD